ncbi:putative RNA-binding Zn ribbon-like protein [Pseudomonas alcaligenes]|nr:putative RNA-binding Zn ribbon-like protein [Pseudomonas alcaligenes]
MEETAQHRAERYISARGQHPAWLLLASRRAALVLGCLRTLFERAHDGIPMEDALQALAVILASYASQELYEIDPDATHLQAGRELREWIKRRLIVEREGRIYATDALEVAIQFVESLDSRIMTSTASRLSVVQREIENLETNLNPSPVSRINSLRRRIKDLEHELEQAEAGHITILDEAQAVEGIREVFNLATSLRADFRRVEDSWRDADRALRQSIISEQHHRGEIIDRLLDGQDALLSTPEGRVFDSFQQQLRQPYELESMRERLRTILRHPAVPKALHRSQQRELRLTVMRLVQESQVVLQARARSERDVRGFMKTGLAVEHHRVGNLLNEIFTLALSLDWQRQSVRRQTVPLPPVGVAITGVPAVERLRFKAVDDDEHSDLDLSTTPTGLEEIGDDFWDAFDGLDRVALINDTLAVLAQQSRPVSLGELAGLLPPAHDLETFALWLGMAREAGIEVLNDEHELVELKGEEQRRWLFRLPYAGLESAALKDIDWEL